MAKHKSDYELGNIGKASEKEANFTEFLLWLSFVF